MSGIGGPGLFNNDFMVNDINSIFLDNQIPAGTRTPVGPGTSQVINK